MPSDSFVSLPSDLNIPRPISIVAWNPKMDLVALVHDATLSVHRLSGAKHLVIPNRKTPITAIAWRPEGNAIAVSHESGKAYVYEIEKGVRLSKLKVHTSPITAMIWVQENGQNSDRKTLYEDRARRFLPHTLASRTGAADGLEEPRLKTLDISDSKLLDLVVTGDAQGNIALSAMGTFLIGRFVVSAGAPVQQISMTGDLGYLSAVVASAGPSPSSDPVRIANIVSLPVLQSRRSELLQLALQGNSISNLISNIKSAIDISLKSLEEMRQTWGGKLDILERSINAHSDDVAGGNIKHSLLLALAKGKCEDAIIQFVTSDLRDQGIKRLERGVDALSGVLREQLVLNAVTAAEALLFRAGELVGLARFSERFGGVGLDEETASGLVKSAAEFVTGIYPILEISQSVRKTHRAFCAWLSSILAKNVDESAVRQSLSMETVADVAEYLNFDLKTDRIGALVSGTDGLLSRFQNLSAAVARLVESPSTKIQMTISAVYRCKLVAVDSGPLTIFSSQSQGNTNFFFCGGSHDVASPLEIQKISISSKSVVLEDFATVALDDLDKTKIKKLLSYDSKTIAAVCESGEGDDTKSSLALIDIENLDFDDSSPSVPTRARLLEGPALIFAVSASRKVSIVQLENPMKIVLFDLEGDEEEEGDGEENNDDSMQE